MIDHQTFLPAGWAFLLHGLGFDTQAGSGAVAGQPGHARDAITSLPKLGTRLLIEHYHHA